MVASRVRPWADAMRRMNLRVQVPINVDLEPAPQAGHCSHQNWLQLGTAASKQNRNHNVVDLRTCQSHFLVETAWYHVAASGPGVVRTVPCKQSSPSTSPSTPTNRQERLAARFEEARACGGKTCKVAAHVPAIRAVNRRGFFPTDLGKV